MAEGNRDYRGIAGGILEGDRDFSQLTCNLKSYIGPPAKLLRDLLPDAHFKGLGRSVPE